LESELEMFTLYGGEVLFSLGEPGDFLCLVINGRMRVVLTNERGEQTVAELGSGEIVGEMAVVTGEPRNATVVAVRDSQLARLTKAAFDRVVKRHPVLGVQVIGRTLAERLAEANTGRHPGRHNVSTVAIVP